MGGEKNCDRNKAKADLKRDIFLEAIRAGQTLTEATHTAGWASPVSYQKHKKTYPMWWAEVEMARAAARGGDIVGLGTDKPGDFSSFVARYFPDRRPHSATQLRIVAEIDRLEPRDIVLVNIFPQAGKTAVLEDYVCRKLAIDPNHRFRYMSESTDLAKRVIGTVKRRMTETSDYPEYIARYGPFYQDNQERNGRPWTTEQITIAKNSGQERDRSLVASSVTSATLGSRIDTLVIDDVCSQKNVAQSEEIVRKIRGTFFTREFQMRTIIIGNRIASGDVYERLRDVGLITREVTIKAADHEGEPTDASYWDHELYHNGGPCCKGFRECPENKLKVTPREYMEMMRHQVGEDQWHAMYQQNPTANERSTFAQFIDRCLDTERVIERQLVA